MPDPICLRPALLADARRIWSWRNEPAVRRASLQQNPIPLKRHLKWYRAVLVDPRIRFFIAEDRRGRPADYVRFQIEGRSAEISLAVDRAFRGRGFGTAMIRAGSRRLLAEGGTRSLIARVRPGNEASIKAFRLAGYSLKALRRHDGIDTVELIYALRRRVRRSAGVLFRVDAGPKAGLGHVQRCLSLAAALPRRRCSFLADGNKAVERLIGSRGFHPLSLGPVRAGSEQDAEKVIFLAQKLKAGTVVVDSYHVGHRYLARLRSVGLFTAVIDDFARHLFPSQLVIAVGVYAPRLGYKSSTRDRRFLLGPRYALLKPEFWKRPLRSTKPQVQNILLTLGGTDPHGLMPALINLLGDVPGDFSMDVVVGPFFKNLEKVRGAAAAARHKVKLHFSPPSLRPLMVAADAAISAAGQTLYELAASGTPTVAVQVAHNQRENGRAFARAGTAFFAGVAGRASILQSVRRRLLDLMRDQRKRAAMAAAGRRLVDGRGALRAAEALERLTGTL